METIFTRMVSTHVRDSLASAVRRVFAGYALTGCTNVEHTLHNVDIALAEGP